jgi:hypothetical protein
MTKILITGDFSVDGGLFPEGYEVIHLSSPKDEHEIATLLPTIEHYILGGRSIFLLTSSIAQRN